MTGALFAFIGLLYGGLLIGPTILPFRNLQRVSFRCDAPGARGFCDQPGTAADFFVRVCGRDDVTLTIDQSRFRKGAVADDLTESDYTIYCHDRDLRVENVVTLEVRGDSYLKQDGRSNALQRAWLSGELTIAEVQERLLSGR